MFAYRGGNYCHKQEAISFAICIISGKPGNLTSTTNAWAHG